MNAPTTEPTELERAEARMRKTKAAFSEAAKRALAGDPSAENAATAAYGEVQAALAALLALDNVEQGQ